MLRVQGWRKGLGVGCWGLGVVLCILCFVFCVPCFCVFVFCICVLCLGLRQRVSDMGKCHTTRTFDCPFVPAQIHFREIMNGLTPPSSVGLLENISYWYLIAEQPAPAPHLAHPERCAALGIVLVTGPRVSRSCEHFPDGGE